MGMPSGGALPRVAVGIDPSRAALQIATLSASGERRREHRVPLSPTAVGTWRRCWGASRRTSPWTAHIRPATCSCWTGSTKCGRCIRSPQPGIPALTTGLSRSRRTFGPACPDRRRFTIRRLNDRPVTIW